MMMMIIIIIIINAIITLMMMMMMTTTICVPNWRARKGEGTISLQRPPPKKLENTNFAHPVISNVLCD